MATLEYPAALRYSRDHEWAAGTDGDGAVRVGITAFAQDSLGDVVFVEAPAVGDSVTAGEQCGEVESTKSVSDLISPVTGTVVEVNESLGDSPEVINSDPYGEGWIFTVSLEGDGALGDLLDSAAYADFVANEVA
ncbi:glycine cleavage system protein GcvH [Brevibacterium sp. 50QC2O2]|jgi:glycine cleavage system H protein|uniref:glycine cleavage system protein GcvH n=1 Tax=Brevibacterium TaxID=1696 RepID=UPI00211BEC78|nr:MULTISPECIES: glycine cleavage system protein GcvH [unclassified Brevibacterium]MCQ9384191.1 glycine cleavage system protein GcvH [Brevibacterium sp. 68QC2CO]MCQ9388331.1 glycine cleavage system protein GcvH [Brevibacterium sp. 50QC2O2]